LGAHDHHGDVRLRLPEAGQELDTVHLWHIDVQQQQLRLVPRDEIQRGRAIGGFPAFLDPDFPQHQADKCPHMRLVIHDQRVGGARHDHEYAEIIPPTQARRDDPVYSARRM
jgi:hypothetical protein